MARKEKLDAAYSIITGDQARAKQSGTSKTLGIALTAEQIQQVDTIAAELQTTRHKVMQYALADFLRRWAAGERPKTRTETKTVLDI